MPKPYKENISDARKKAFDLLNIPYDKRAIISLDGGGMRGILTIQLLKKLEEIAKIPCYEIFDMVCGTSTGAIIAGLIVYGKNATEIEKLYVDLVNKVFDKKFMHDQIFNPPKFSKKNYRMLLKQTIGDITLEQAVEKTNCDLLITSQDISAAEETFFSCFSQNDQSHYGTYSKSLLRAVMEATMSAPTYFYPLERFVDGGTTTYNNPSLAAFIEATSYSAPRKNNDTQINTAAEDLYPMNKIVLFSFGTGISRIFINPDQTIDPKGLDISFWLNWLMTQTGQDASAMQINAFRSPIIKRMVDFRRFQITLDKTAIKKLPNTDALDKQKYGSKWLHDIDEKILQNIDMSDVSKFDLMLCIGEQMAKFIEENGNCFRDDLVDNRNHDLLVTFTGDVERIKKQMSDSTWLDSYIS